MDADGDFVVVWFSAHDGVYGDIYAQRYNRMGVAQDGEFRVNTYTTGVQSQPTVAMDADGDFVVTWGSHNGMFAQRYNAAGVAQDTEFRIGPDTANGGSPAVAMDADGDFVVVWVSSQQNGSGNGVYAQRYNAMGVAQGGEFRINEFTTSYLSDSAVAMDADGDFVVVWYGFFQGDSPNHIRARRFNAMGVDQGPEFRVASFTTTSQKKHAVAMDADGDFVITWRDRLDGSGYGVYAQRYNSVGEAQGAELLVNASTANNQLYPSVAMDTDGDFVVAWQSYMQDGSFNGVYAQRFDAMGVVQGEEFCVNTYTTNDQRAPVVAMDATGDFAVVWESYGQDGSNVGIYARLYQPNRTPTAISSGPVAIPNPAEPGAPVQFAAEATGEQTLAYAWDFGDGSSGTGASPSHAYAAAGAYTATLTITDATGSAASASVAVKVSKKPTARFITSDIVAFEGMPFGFDASFSTDPENAIASYAWSFGDGSPDGAGQIISKIYAQSGSYPVTLTVTDAVGQVATTTRVIEVLDQSQMGLFNSSVVYTVSWDRTKLNKDTLKLSATLNTGDAAVGAGTAVALEIAGVRFAGTLDKRLMDRRDKNAQWKVIAGTKRQRPGEVALTVKLKKANLGLAFNLAGAVAGNDPDADVEAVIPVRLEVAGRTFELLLDSDFSFSKGGSRAKGGGDGP